MIELGWRSSRTASCLVVRRVAVDRPERVDGLVLEASPTTLRGHHGLAAFVASVLTGLRDPIDPAFASSFVADTSSGQIKPEVLDRLAGEVLKVPAHVWQESFTDLLDYDDLDQLGSITAPTMLIWGDGDAIVDRHMQERLTELIPHADLLVYPGIGHTRDGRTASASLPMWPLSPIDRAPPECETGRSADGGP